MTVAYPPFILLAAGGHAKVVLDLLRRCGHTVKGVCDPGLVAGGHRLWRGVDVLGDDSALHDWSPDHVSLASGLGSLPGQAVRQRIYEKLTSAGYRFPALVHPTACLGEAVQLADGVQVMAGAILQADTRIGENSLINTGARIDHDCQIGRHVHVAPGATLSGKVEVDDGAHIGTGATVIQGLTIGQGSVVGAGTTVIRNVPAAHQVTGASPKQPHPLRK